MFVYCTQALRLTESAAYDRIEAARASRQFPLVLQRLVDGAVTLTAVRLLAPHLTMANCAPLLESARHKSKRDILQLLACLAPQPDVAASVRRLPGPRPKEATSAEGLFAIAAESAGAADLPVSDAPRSISSVPTQAPRATVAPLAPERYLIKLTVSRETHDKFRRAQDLLRHTLPSGDPAAVVDRALTVLVEQLERRRLAKSNRPRSKAVSAANTSSPRPSFSQLSARSSARGAPPPRSSSRVAEAEHGRCPQSHRAVVRRARLGYRLRRCPFNRRRSRRRSIVRNRCVSSP